LKTRELKRRFINISMATLLGFLMGLADAQSEDSDRPQPNIVFILADDVGIGDVACYGGALIKTPNIDKLAEQGLRFTQAYSGGPVCTPSRSALMTGLHGGHGPARDNVPHYKTYLDKDDTTMAEVLGGAGYRCGGFGKWSLGDAGTIGRATAKGFDEWFGYLNQDHAHYYYPEYLDDNEGRLELTGNTESREFYSHDLIVDRSLDFIRRNSGGPFFAYCAFTLPHFSARSEDPDRLAVPDLGSYATKDWDLKSKKYAAMVERLDRDVGRIVDLVDELGISDQTLVIFTSDNGGHSEMSGRFDSNGPLRGFKSDVFEGGIRVPFIARWPGMIPAGETSDAILTFWDMLPTFAELAGADKPSRLDGTSVVDALMGGAVKMPHEYLYWDYGHCRDRYDQAVRMGKWKGIRLGVGSPLQLYDLESDIAERHDLAQKHPEIAQRIESIMHTAVEPHDRYPVGSRYRGKPIWKKSLPKN